MKIFRHSFCLLEFSLIERKSEIACLLRKAVIFLVDTKLDRKLFMLLTELRCSMRGIRGFEVFVTIVAGLGPLFKKI